MLRAGIVLVAALLAGCAAPASDGARTLHFDVANEAQGLEAVVVHLAGPGGERETLRRTPPYDPVVPSDAFEVNWSAARVDVRVEREGSPVVGEGSFDLRGLERAWIYVALYDDRTRVELYEEPPAFM